MRVIDAARESEETKQLSLLKIRRQIERARKVAIADPAAVIAMAIGRACDAPLPAMRQWGAQKAPAEECGLSRRAVTPDAVVWYTGNGFAIRRRHRADRFCDEIGFMKGTRSEQSGPWQGALLVLTVHCRAAGECGACPVPSSIGHARRVGLEPQRRSNGGTHVSASC